MSPDSRLWELLSEEKLQKEHFTWRLQLLNSLYNHHDADNMLKSWLVITALLHETTPFFEHGLLWKFPLHEVPPGPQSRRSHDLFFQLLAWCGPSSISAPILRSAAHSYVISWHSITTKFISWHFSIRAGFKESLWRNEEWKKHLQ